MCLFFITNKAVVNTLVIVSLNTDVRASHGYKLRSGVRRVRVYTASTCLSANYCNNLHSQKQYVSIPVYLSNIHYFQILILVYMLYTCCIPALITYTTSKFLKAKKNLKKKKKTLMNENLCNSALKSGGCTSICVTEHI